MYDLAENATVNPATNQTFGGPRTMDTGLLNGKNVWVPANSTVSSGSRTEFPSIVAGKSYRLRIINAAIQSTYKVYIDGHTFDVIQSDFVPIKPYSASILNINIGMRTSIFRSIKNETQLIFYRSTI
jgi:FtsP/CotA-like multicopper oxidase with cupredoxin domain